ncbi:Non-heme 11 kDa protein of cytochrome bc1 complex [Hysterangium stoloniferum]|nr:Non-heme 11 kDa protein of cytochrome bc1 complex [Hysterangium stoloniferum]
MLSGLFSSFVVHADAKQEPEAESVDKNEDNKEEGGEADAGGEAEAEEEEPEDASWYKPHPAIREECSNSSACISLKKHFDHCQEKVQAGEGFKGENCVEEMCTFFHSATCAAPNLFSKLR